MPDRLVPDGPLHPELVIAGVFVGLAAAVVARRGPGRHPLLLPLAWLLAMEIALPGVLGHALGTHGAGAVAVVAVASAAMAFPRMPARGAWAEAMAATTAVWALVPDTEAAVVALGVVAAGVFVPVAPGARRAEGLLVAVPLVATLPGTVGRPDRLPVAVIAATVAALAVQALWAAGGRSARQRAGTPTTVVPGSTSSTTTAPAPTTAP